MGDERSVKKYDGTRFSIWRAQVESILDEKDCLDAILSPKPRNIITGKPEEISIPYCK